MLVVFTHMPAWALPHNPLECHGDGFCGGAIGVDIFFCISGFLMLETTERLQPGLRAALQFLVKRAFRIWPMYIIATLLYNMLSTGEPVTKWKSLFFLWSWTGDTFVAPDLFVGWTLNYEVYFYCIAAVGLLFALKIRGAALVTGALGIAAMFSAAVSHYMTSIIIEFSFGVALAAALKNPRACAALRRYRVVILVAAVIAIGMVLDANVTPLPPGIPFGGEINLYGLGIAAPRFIAWGVPAALLVTGVVLFEEKISRSASRLGDYTYSIYLLHLSMIHVVAAMGSFVPPEKFPAASHSGIFAVVFILVTVGAAIATYRVIEVPFHNAGKALARRLR